MSVPAAKAPPAPETISARTSPRPISGSAQISASRAYMAKVSALRCAGRLKVTWPMPSATL